MRNPGPHEYAASAKMPGGRPVFVVGSPRSGTTFLYDILLSSGKFAVYRAESDVFFRIAPAFGSLKSLSHRTKLVDAWLKSDYFTRTGLNASWLREKVLSECRNPGDFLRIFMDGIAREQGLNRWAENTPFHVLYMSEIKRTIPNALFVHIIRDGRDAAVSMSRLGWPGCFARDAKYQLAISALYWRWLVSQGRKAGIKLGHDYFEVRYEELVERPHPTLKTLSEFIGEDFVYDRIWHSATGALTTPNSSFPTAHGFHPIGRWRNVPEKEFALANSLLEPLLRDLGYETQPSRDRRSLTWRLTASYLSYWALKRKIKGSPLSRLFVSRERLERGALDRFDQFWDHMRAGPSGEPR